MVPKHSLLISSTSLPPSVEDDRGQSRGSDLLEVTHLEAPLDPRLPPLPALPPSPQCPPFPPHFFLSSYHLISVKTLLETARFTVFSSFFILFFKCVYVSGPNSILFSLELPTSQQLLPPPPTPPSSFLCKSFFDPATPSWGSSASVGPVPSQPVGCYNLS